ncbi:CD2 antigen cytoplasmic tail-binding protein 2 [Paragonimus heterotremus]|uniref:CD2 antigen cytoplasmic tail-binding protein 2 n=1 Tax=Paragonimus heterotremus TaxID=100268 RepID=A0A8J4WEX1_9TREM|nr:CD2 antigen cytoplasmic tail-binding protein 2 [Paragonimus heterotremus]
MILILPAAQLKVLPYSVMSKRGAIGAITQEEKAKQLKLSKPSLDSDEEDYQESECFRLREADIDGQENATLEYDDDIKITPFNMREELEDDGYFDGDGNFVFKKNVRFLLIFPYSSHHHLLQTDAKDNWLENIDWVEVNKLQQTKKITDTAISDEPPDVPVGSSQKTELYQQLISLMKPKETVLRSIKRMGAHSNTANSASASQRWLKKKQHNTSAVSGDPEGLIRATEMADRLLQAGEFDVYQMTFEAIETMLRKANDAEPEDELEALGKAFDKTNDPDRNTSQSEQVTDSENGTTNRRDPISTGEDASVVTWHLKYSDKEDAAVEGPYTTAQLREWTNSGKFKNSPTVLVRQTDRVNGQFYNLNRIDLELYE